MSSFEDQECPLTIVLCCILLLPLTAEASSHLTKAIESLRIVVGMESEYFGDIDV